jgi:hypothetical protein
MSRKIQKRIEWRRSKVQEWVSKGYNQIEIAERLLVDVSTICRDCAYLNKQAKENMKQYLDEKLPREIEKCLIGFNLILKEAWTIAENAKDERVKIQGLLLAKDCYPMILEMLTNVNVVNNAIKFISAKKDKINNIIEEQIDDNIIKEKEQIDIQGSEEDTRSEQSSYNKTF